MFASKKLREIEKTKMIRRGKQETRKFAEQWE